MGKIAIEFWAIAVKDLSGANIVKAPPPLTKLKVG
jgi:hypothetical protein